MTINIHVRDYNDGQFMYMYTKQHQCKRIQHTGTKYHVYYNYKSYVHVHVRLANKKLSYATILVLRA